MLNDLVKILSYAVAFGAGFILCDRMYTRFDKRLRSSLRMQYSRLIRHLDADDPQVDFLPARKPFVVPEEFANKLKETGRATTILN